MAKKADISTIIPNLLMGSQPTSAAYRELEERGVQLIINTRIFPDRRRNTSIPTENFRAIDAPFFQISMKYLLRGTQDAVELIKNNSQVFVHCRRGRHRSALMAAAILIALGHSSAEAIALIKKGRPAANPNIFYIKRRIKQFERVWKTQTFKQ
ncbi:MAG: dual specificity protein phosphatase family protein [Patescibacteria group bacterium]|nr:dual specificity protein phosphatase family protein [Patescibacteria group bacterium]